MIPPKPLPNSYWIVPGRLLGGEYPGAIGVRETRERLRLLLAAGIDAFVDLTSPGEREPYQRELPAGVDYFQRSIQDHGVPRTIGQMGEVLDTVQRALASGRRVYLHCRAGIGRTAMVAGCLLVEQGHAPKAALKELNRRWLACARADEWPKVPETEEQAAFVRRWLPRGTSAASPAPPVRGPAPRVQLAERFAGALVGLAVGDALSVTTQGVQPGTFPEVSDLVGGGAHGLPRGAWTDDTGMALCLAESLIERDGFDVRDQIDRYGRWLSHGHLSSTGAAVGVRAATERALALARWRRQSFAGSHNPRQQDPEPLARVAPTVMFFYDSQPEALLHVADAARVTSQSPRVLDACRLAGAFLHRALAGKTKEEILAPDRDIGPRGLRRRVDALAHGSYRGKEAAAVHAADTAVEVLEVALWAFHRSDDFRSGALLVANRGLNSDIAGSVYGQLAGAHYGVAAIPHEWRAALARHELIASLATRLVSRVRNA